ncbi:hypothetical protein BX616_010598 [Lobosporangium transversale]|uniref:Uncharacterized protein n=1 Tax=Lobosporangium transversale TaxID=64571 RepID=A0A1Y2H2J8_9FUNG|nr:hypothetical protein BCR41DRAFT_344826 [Lobosporangium transversale]KAF9918014.1 hypothetical protein BX616_010598 [Lobosporangium transversale]ORZ28201.1 hypothetical protein BCR41DRAFT_344826 [Lobosporangium transversale]|eukprot:XP_021885886.1 hypothetical protein BCR41DRAFT_344826 [Lobosporangium transversale]
MIATTSQKLRSWFASITSPSATHASGMLILVAILAAVTEAHADSVAAGSERTIYSHHHPKDSSSSNQASDAHSRDLPFKSEEQEAETKALNNQDMLYYVALGMLVSQGLIRLITFISNRREAAARKEDNGSEKKSRKDDLSLNALEDLDEETLKRRRQEHLATLAQQAPLLGSDSEDEDYEEGTSESESESEEDIDEDVSNDEDLNELHDENTTGVVRRRHNWN